MLRPRIIPCLLIQKRGLVKTVYFKSPKYVGDPINAVRIFNEKLADELMVLDIDCSKNGIEPDYRMIRNLASECRMPLCYGGGIKTPEQAKKIISLGVEKIAISSAAIQQPKLIQDVVKEIGSQSLVVVFDVKKKRLTKGYDTLIYNGSLNTRRSVFELVAEVEKLGAGEIVINSIDRDGAMNGYDIELAKKIMQLVSIPVTMVGGAGNLDHVGELIQSCGIIGASAGSLFVFKGPYKAVLINYPTITKRDELVQKYLL